MVKESLCLFLFLNTFLVPAAPVGVTVTDVTSTSFNISWMVPSILNGFISLYEITIVGVDSVNPVPPQFYESVTLNTTEMDEMLVNLIPYSTYQVQVRAKTAAGFGVYSQRRDVETLEDSML